MWKKKVKEPPNVTKVQSYVILVLHNMKMVPSNVRKNKETTVCDKSTITCDVSNTQCEDGTIKCEKKNKGTTECNKSTVTCDVDTAQCENGTIKCEKKLRKQLNVTKVQSHVMLVLHNMKMVPSNIMFW